VARAASGCRWNETSAYDDQRQTEDDSYQQDKLYMNRYHCTYPPEKQTEMYIAQAKQMLTSVRSERLEFGADMRGSSGGLLDDAGVF